MWVWVVLNRFIVSHKALCQAVLKCVARWWCSSYYTMSMIDLTNLCERMQKKGYVWASLQGDAGKDLWANVSQGSDPSKKGWGVIKPEGVFFSQLRVSDYDDKLEPAWKTFVEHNDDDPRWYEDLAKSWLVFVQPKASACFITEDNGLMAYQEGTDYIRKQQFRFNDILPTQWDGVEIDLETTKQDNAFDTWNITTLVVWNKACLETCIAFKPVPNQQFTYYDSGVDLDVRGDGSRHIEAQPGLTAEARAELVALNTQTDKIVDYLETVTRRWDNMYLDRLRSFDNEHSEAMAKFIKKHWKGASRQITALFKMIHDKRNEVRGTPALGLYTFYEHVWMQVRGVNGFDPQELRKPVLGLVSQVFVDSYQKAIPMGGLESRWVSETLEDFCHTQLDKMTETKKKNVQEEMKQEADYWRHTGKGEYSVMVALLDELSVYKTQREIGKMVSQIVRRLKTRVSRLETEVGQAVCA